MKEWEQHLAKHIMEGKERTEKGKKLKKIQKLALEGLALYTFAWPAKEFQAFIDAFCNENKKPNEAVWELIAEAMERKAEEGANYDS